MGRCAGFRLRHWRTTTCGRFGSVSRRVVWSPRRAIWWTGCRNRGPIVRRTIVPVAAIAGASGIWNRTRTVPDVRRAIRISPSDPGDVVVIAPVRSPTPSPPTPSPRPVVNQQSPNRDSRSESDQRGHDHSVWAGSDINHGGIVDRHINHLRVGWLDDINGLSRRLLHLHLLLGSTVQRPGRISLGS